MMNVTPNIWNGVKKTDKLQWIKKALKKSEIMKKPCMKSITESESVKKLTFHFFDNPSNCSFRRSGFNTCIHNCFHLLFT